MEEDREQDTLGFPRARQVKDQQEMEQQDEELLPELETKAVPFLHWQLTPE